MKYLAALVFLIACIALGTQRADATTCTVPNTFTNGTTADATQVNANFSALQSCGNNIDHTNVGGSGIYASQIIPTTVGQAIFGGTVAYSFTSGLSVTGGLTVDTLTLATPLGQSNILNGYVDLSSTQTINGAKTFGVIPVWTGAISVGQGGTGATSLSAAHIAQTNTNNTLSGWLSVGPSTGSLTVGDVEAARSASTGAIVLGASTESATLDYNVTNSHATTLTCNGSGCGAKLVVSGGFVAPVYTASGAQTANTTHIVRDSCSFSASTTCAVSLSGSAAFASASSYMCWPSQGAGATTYYPTYTSGTSWTLNSNNGSTSATVQFTCLGT